MKTEKNTKFCNFEIVSEKISVFKKYSSDLRLEILLTFSYGFEVYKGSFSYKNLSYKKVCNILKR